jgi:hypothetical protein
MGTLTLAELRDEIKGGLASRTELASSNTKVDRWINLAQTRMVRRSRFTELNTIEDFSPSFTGQVSTDKIIPFSSLSNNNPRAILSITRVESDNSDKLIFVPFRLWDRRLPNVEQYGSERPTHYTVYKKQIELWRVPNIAYTYRIRLSRWPIPLVNITDLSELDEKDDAIIAMAKYYACLHYKMHEQAAVMLTEYNRVMGDAHLEDFDQPDFDAVEPHRGGASQAGQYWSDPFAKSAPR